MPSRGAKYITESNGDGDWPAFSRRLYPGLRIGVWYSDDTVWHERLLLYPVSEKEWVIRTPDGDQYIEQIDALDPNGSSKLALCGPKGQAPDVLGGKFYRFAERADDDELRQMIGTAKGQAKEGGSTITPAFVMTKQGEKLALLPWLNPGAVAEQLQQRVALAKDDEKGEDLDPGEDHVWVSLESVGNEITMGQEVALVSGDVRMGDRGLHVMSDGSIVTVKRVTLEQATAGPTEPVGGGDANMEQASDLRVISPAVYTKTGKRWGNFQSMIDHLAPEDMPDWPLEGERTAEWLCSFIVQHGPTPDARHTKWASEQGVGADTMGYILHDLIGYILELALSYDQLDISNLASMEMVARVYQLLEETKGTMMVEGLEHYIGRSKTGGRKRGVALAPSLAKHVTTNLGTDIEILKQRRKAREEEAAAKDATKKHKGGNQGGGGGAK